MTSKTFREVLEENASCVIVPCVYDCASARVLELVGYQAMMLSSGELSLAMNGIIDYGLTGLTDCEWMVSRISRSSVIPLAVDIEDGYGSSPIAIYRTCKRLAAAGAMALQMEDTGDMMGNGELLPREKYFAKVKAAVDALKGTDCMLIARTNADPITQMEEGCERMRTAHELGAELTTVVRISDFEQAKYVAEHVPGWKMFPDVTAVNGKPAVTIEDITPLGYKIMTTHFTLKAAMDGMLKHAYENLKNQNVVYTWDTPCEIGGKNGFSATAYFDPDSYMRFESGYTGTEKEYVLSAIYDESFPVGLKRYDVKDRL